MKNKDHTETFVQSLVTAGFYGSGGSDVPLASDASSPKSVSSMRLSSSRSQESRLFRMS